MTSLLNFKQGELLLFSKDEKKQFPTIINLATRTIKFVQRTDIFAKSRKIFNLFFRARTHYIYLDPQCAVAKIFLQRTSGAVARQRLLMIHPLP